MDPIDAKVRAGPNRLLPVLHSMPLSTVSPLLDLGLEIAARSTIVVVAHPISVGPVARLLMVHVAEISACTYTARNN